jgi:3-deoxy-D-manno-octulosonic-acid transferase
VFYKPVAFGPNNKKFKEAQDLLQQQSAKEINNKEDLASWVEHLLTDEEYYSTSCTLNGQYVENNAGATQKILKEINQYL